MSENEEDRLPLLVQNLRQIQNASHVLAECLAWFSEEPEENQARQMDKLYGVAYLMGLLSQQVDQAQLILQQEIASR